MGLKLYWLKLRDQSARRGEVPVDPGAHHHMLCMLLSRWKYGQCGIQEAPPSGRTSGSDIWRAGGGGGGVSVWLCSACLHSVLLLRKGLLDCNGCIRVQAGL